MVEPGAGQDGPGATGPGATGPGATGPRRPAPDAAPPTLRQLLDGATRVLSDAGVPSPRHDAHALAAHALGVERVEPVLAPPPPPGFAAALAQLVERRRLREPLQQIVGRTGFRYVTLRVAPGVFVPRPETEVVAGAAVAEVQRLDASVGSAVVTPARGRHPGMTTSPPTDDLASGPGGPSAPPRWLVVDLCTGSGAVAAAVDSETAARVVAMDASADAVALARENLEQVGKAPVRVELGDVRDPALLDDLDATVDVVVANPPYIPPDAVPTDPEVRDHDPDLALYGGGPDGLALPGAVVACAARLLRPGGLLVMEHADAQGEAVRALVEATGDYRDVVTEQDLTGRDRFVRARRLGRD